MGQIVNICRHPVEKLQVALRIEDAAECLLNKMRSFAAYRHQLLHGVRIDAIFAVSHRSARQHCRKIQEIRGEPLFTHRFQQVRDTAAAGKWVGRSLEVEATQDAVKPRQQTVFGPHVAQLGKSERLLRKRNLVEHLATMVEFYSIFGPAGYSVAHLYSLAVSSVSRRGLRLCYLVTGFMYSTLYAGLSLRQPGIEVACEGIAIRLSERRRTTADIAAGAHCVHEISHGEHSANGIRGVALSPGVERLASFGDDLSGERYISRDDQVARRHALDDFCVGHIEPCGYLNRAQARNARNLQGLIGDQRHRDANALGRAKQNVLDDIRASICVDPNTGSRHVRPSINAHASAAQYTRPSES